MRAVYRPSKRSGNCSFQELREHISLGKCNSLSAGIEPVNLREKRIFRLV